MSRADTWTPAPGDILYENYRADRYLGKGGVNFLWEVAPLLIGGPNRAMKFFRDESAWEREVKALKSIKGENVGRMLDNYCPEEDPSIPYWVIVYEMGQFTLDTYLRHERPADPLRVKSVLFDILEGLAACHDKGIVHCDLKPQNIMFFQVSGMFDRWKLIDFDSATPVGQSLPRVTIDFCAPEMFIDPEGALADYPLDMFSLGRTIQWMTSYMDKFWCTETPLDTRTFHQIMSDPTGELPLESSWIPHAPSRNKVAALLRRDPKARMTLNEFRNSSYITGNLDTIFINSLESKRAIDQSYEEEEEDGSLRVIRHSHLPYRTYALYNNPPESFTEPREISFRVGDALEILQDHGQWWCARVKGGAEGLVPNSYVLRTSHAPCIYRTRAIFSNTPEAGNCFELAFEVGEEIEVLEDSGEWIQGRREDGTIGIIPPDYILKGSLSEVKFKARALYSYQSNHVNELTFDRGEVLDILETTGDMWQAKTAMGTLGIVHSSYFQQASLFKAEHSVDAEGTESVLDLVSWVKRPAILDVRAVKTFIPDLEGQDYLSYYAGERMYVVSMRGDRWVARKLDGLTGFLGAKDHVTSLPRVKALASYQAESPDHLTLEAHESLVLLDSLGDVCMVREDSGKTGLVPTRLLMIKDPMASRVD